MKPIEILPTILAILILIYTLIDFHQRLLWLENQVESNGQMLYQMQHGKDHHWSHDFNDVPLK